MKKTPWTEAEERTLLDAVGKFRSTYKYNGHNKPAVDWFKVSSMVNQKHGNYRTKQGCRARYGVIK